MKRSISVKFYTRNILILYDKNLSDLAFLRVFTTSEPWPSRNKSIADTFGSLRSPLEHSPRLGPVGWASRSLSKKLFASISPAPYDVSYSTISPTTLAQLVTRPNTIRRGVYSSEYPFHLIVGAHVTIRWPLRYRNHANKMDMFTVRKYTGILIRLLCWISCFSNPRMPKP